VLISFLPSFHYGLEETENLVVWLVKKEKNDVPSETVF
jgi:hypothetical protein